MISLLLVLIQHLLEKHFYLNLVLDKMVVALLNIYIKEKKSVHTLEF